MAKKNLKKGILITFEGPEGCGKSTQSKLLYEYLKTNSYNCVYTREPGGTRLGEKVRQVLLHSKDINITDLTEVFLFEAARAEIVKKAILPNLKKGRIIICDRFSDATIAYQGYGGKVSLKMIKALNNIATGGIKPAMTILLDVDTITGLKRARKKGIDRMEAKDIAYHKRVRAGYLTMEKREPERIKVVRVQEDLHTTQKIIRKIVDEFLKHKNVKP